MKSIGTLGTLFGTLSLLCVLGGCASESDAEGDDAASTLPSDAQEVSPTATKRVSFVDSCKHPHAEGASNGAVVSASASSCQRRNGTWTGPKSWSGQCFRDLENNDGNLRCR
ncbi:hypothetical protein LVJ94_48455 [Pendulispora rubella]|uniref:Uncharacterized protein n=1 Tax=Pendulispora rubella TaxID=2741070 RepID=A0ABZ2L1A0_9BACT